MNHERIIHFTNGVLHAINAGMWAFWDKPHIFMALVWLAVSAGSFYAMSKS